MIPAVIHNDVKRKFLSSKGYRILHDIKQILLGYKSAIILSFYKFHLNPMFGS